jgi:hypothetical protein
MLGRVSRRKPILILLICLILASCSRPKTVPRKELRSDLISAISLASETELFLGQLLEGRATPLFAQGHLEYLHQEATRAADALEEAHAGEGMAAQLESCRTQMAALALLLAGLQNRTEAGDRLSDDRQQARTIRLILEQVNGQL